MLLPLSLGLPLLLLQPQASQETLRFAPASGLQLQKRILLESQAMLDALRVVSDGVEQETEVSMQLGVRQELQLSDHYKELRSLKPMEVERRFERIRLDLTGQLSAPVIGPQTLQFSGKSPLEGQTVIHRRSGPSSAWRHSLASAEKQPKAKLEGLSYDLDFSGLLPEEPVQVGSLWSVPPAQLHALLVPAGDLQLRLEPGPDNDLDVPPGAQSPVLGPLRGRIGASLLGLENHELGRLARVELSIEVSCSQDLTEPMSSLLKMSTGPGGIEMQSGVQSYSMRWKFTGRGELLWNLERGHLSSLSIEGKYTQIVESSTKVLVAGIEQLISNHMQLSGTQRASLLVSPIDPR